MDGASWFTVLVGVATQEEEAIAAVWRSNGRSANTTPDRIIPPAGKELEDSIKSSILEGRHVFQEDALRVCFLDDAGEFEP
jgi:hypothetical protein